MTIVQNDRAEGGGDGGDAGTVRGGATFIDQSLLCDPGVLARRETISACAPVALQVQGRMMQWPERGTGIGKAT